MVQPVVNVRTHQRNVQITAAISVQRILVPTVAGAAAQVAVQCPVTEPSAVVVRMAIIHARPYQVHLTR